MKPTKTMKLVIAHLKSGLGAYHKAANTGARTRCLLAMRDRGLIDLGRGGEWVLTSLGRRS